jgi:hypothetical protein
VRISVNRNCFILSSPLRSKDNSVDRPEQGNHFAQQMNFKLLEGEDACCLPNAWKKRSISNCDDFEHALLYTPDVTLCALTNVLAML